MDKHRVILANEPRLLRDLLKRVLERELAVEIFEADPHTLPVPQTRGELLIVALDRQGRIPRRLRHLLRRQTTAGGMAYQVLGVAADASHARLYRPQQMDMVWDPIRLDDLLGLIHSRE